MQFNRTDVGVVATGGGRDARVVEQASQTALVGGRTECGALINDRTAGQRRVCRSRAAVDQSQSAQQRGERRCACAGLVSGLIESVDSPAIADQVVSGRSEPADDIGAGPGITNVSGDDGVANRSGAWNMTALAHTASLLVVVELVISDAQLSTRVFIRI